MMQNGRESSKPIPTWEKDTTNDDYKENITYSTSWKEAIYVEKEEM